MVNMKFPFLAVQLTYGGLMLIVGCYFAIRVKNFKFKAFSETNELLFAIYTFAMIFIVIVIIQITTQTQVIANPIIICILCVAAPCLSISILYLPRIYAIYFKNDETTSSIDSGIRLDSNFSSGGSQTAVDISTKT